MWGPESPGELLEWLEGQDLPVLSWGVGGAKTLDDLWHEIESGEATLLEDPPRRRVEVVTLGIRRDGEVLTETVQLMAGGTVRRRDRPPAEKMRPGETVTGAALRCVVEELGADGPDVVVDPDSVSTTVEWLSSPSYPGLRTEYVFHAVDVDVPGLPVSDFWTREKGDGTVVAHLWGWRQP